MNLKEQLAKDGIRQVYDQLGKEQRNHIDHGNRLVGIQSLYANLQKIRLSEKMTPVIFLGALVLSFGLTIFSLGIYQDDWVFVYNAYIRGPEGLWKFLTADGTPFSSFMNIALFKLLGFKPWHWHVAALIARWLTVVSFWMVLRRLWPKNPSQNFWAALLFAVYPFFSLQPLAFTFLHVWVSFFFLGISIYWMILAVQSPKRFWLFFILSLVAGIITELTLEYFMGLELLRPFILWMILRPGEKNNRTALVKVIKYWTPYLLTFGLYVWWRFFVYHTAGTPHSPIGLELLFTDPLAEARVVFSNILPDMLTMLVAPWLQILDPSFYDLTDRQNILFFTLSVLAGLVLFLAFSIRGDKENTDDQQHNSNWYRQGLWAGIVVLVFGLIPPYVVGLYINDKNPLWSNRLGMASMLGAAMIVVSVVELLIYKLRNRIIIIAILAGLAIGYHARYTNSFRWAWNKELNLYHQLKLRVPDLQPNSAFIADQEILYYMGDYPTAYALNTIYGEPLNESEGEIDHWFFAITSNFGKDIDGFLAGTDISAQHRTLNFAGRSDQSLIISFEPDAGQCLYVIRPQDATFRRLPALLRDASHLSDLSRIITTADSSSSFLDVIDAEFPDNWCAYFQKADLARQKEDYDEVIMLWNDAQEKGFSPGAYFEYMPFIDAYTKLGRWKDAEELTFTAVYKFPALRLPVCDYWHSLPVTSEMNSTLQSIEAELKCVPD